MLYGGYYGNDPYGGTRTQFSFIDSIVRLGKAILSTVLGKNVITNISKFCQPILTVKNKTNLTSKQDVVIADTNNKKIVVK